MMPHVNERCRIQVFMSHEGPDYLQCVPHDWYQELPSMPECPGELAVINDIARQHEKAQP